jgi:hypothetical protein
VKPVSRGIDRIETIFDEGTLVANAGLLLVATVSTRLGLEALIDSTVHLVGRVGGARPGRKILTLVHAIAAGAVHIDHADMLRAGGSERVVGHAVMAPSTLGTFLRGFTFGHLRQLDRVISEAIGRAWAAGAGPDEGRLVIDLDSTVAEVHGYQKQGAGYGYTRQLGYHPILATRADTGEILHARMRKGSANTARGTKRFIEELVARLRRAGASGELVMRFDSGFWSNATIETLGRLDVRYTMAVRTGNKAVAAAIAGITETAWVDIDYTPDGKAQVAECDYTSGRGRHTVTRRLIVRRTRLTNNAQARLWPDWRHHAFLTDQTDDAVSVDAFHRHHATVELAIRDLKEGAGLEHVPSGHFFANGAWLACAVLAHNLIRWTAHLGGVTPRNQLVVARTIRTRLIAAPRPARQPSRNPHPPTPHPLAMGRDLHPHADHPPPAANGARLTPARRDRRPRRRPPRRCQLARPPRPLLPRAPPGRAQATIHPRSRLPQRQPPNQQAVGGSRLRRSRRVRLLLSSPFWQVRCGAGSCEDGRIRPHDGPWIVKQIARSRPLVTVAIGSRPPAAALKTLDCRIAADRPLGCQMTTSRLGPAESGALMYEPDRLATSPKDRRTTKCQSPTGAESRHGSSASTPCIRMTLLPSYDDPGTRSSSLGSASSISGFMSSRLHRSLAFSCMS